MTASRQAASSTLNGVPEVVPSFPLETGTNGVGAGDGAYLATRLLWQERRFLGRFALRCTTLFVLIAFLIPNSYESRTQLMPPDSESSTLGMLAG